MPFLNIQSLDNYIRLIPLLLSILIVDTLFCAPLNGSAKPPTIKLTLPHLEFVLIPSGEFVMGSPAEEEHRYGNEEPLHAVSIDSFYLMTTEITQAVWKEIIGDNPSLFKFDNHPVEGISWYDAKQFIDTLNQKYSDCRFRLPTEAEWEYACRAGTTTPFHTGETINTDQADFDGTYSYGKGWRGVSRGTTLPVKSFLPNTWGLYDMHGNVWEWVEDWDHPDYKGAPTDGSAWIEPVSEYRVLRGGSWYNYAGNCRSANRNRLKPSYRLYNNGFRLVMEIISSHPKPE